ncbi:hypothetical protein [Alicyclobacillus fastidiosus]|uniref:Glycosyltransferase RgtA/B/C/D-like domain-containing protein n=1 Tax=Alicyclobacillus fastidiosus TaxID=392011 RepID=A0ABV5AEN7_9BACL|nr:hypothetical protein [Alicyclobacillus fastidiosus]WEH09563.1 hypothetical protein PYS47_23475 [Alicyclobacillus fastidiosus]
MKKDVMFRKFVISLLGLTIIGIGFNMWQSIVSIPVIGGSSIVLTFIGLLLIASAFAIQQEINLSKLEVLSLCLTIIAVLGWTLTNLYFAPAYGTDEVAYEQYAAQLFTQGIDPYGKNLMHALEMFQVPIQYATYTMNGNISTALAYPDLSFLFIVPFLKLGFMSQAAIYNNILFFISSMIVGYLLLPRPYKLISPIVFAGIPVLFGYMVAGINDIVFMPFLMLAAYRWTRYDGKGLWAWISPIAYGLACSVQQLPWFIAPFLLLGIYIERRHSGMSANHALIVISKYASLSLTAFCVVNLPFMLWNPGSWLSGIFTPLIQHAIPYGQGLVDLSAFFGIGGGHTNLYTDGALLVILALLVVYIIYYNKMRYLTFFIPAIALFFPARSLAEYFSNLIMVSIISAFTIEEYRQEDAKRGWNKRLVVAAAFIPAMICFGVAIFTPSPLSIKVLSFRTDGELRGVQRLNISVENNSRATLTPHFAVNYIGQMTTFWLVDEGPKTLKPKQEAIYELSAPNFGSISPVTQAFQVQAVTPKPETLSISNTVLPEQLTTHITPSYFNHGVRLGQSVHMQVQLRNHYGARVYEKGIPVSLNQIIYGESALIAGESKINNGNVGETPIVAYTDARGIASFTITDNTYQDYPIYYEAWISQSGKYPYGYSEIVSINWKK